MSQPAPTKQHEMRHDMETMAALVAMERLMAKRSAAVPRLLEFVAEGHAVLAGAAMRALFTQVPLAALPKRWQASVCENLAPASASVHTLPAWISENPFNLDELAAFCRLCVKCMQGLPSAAARTKFLHRLAALPGAVDELAAYFLAQGLTGETQELHRHVAELARQQYPQQVSFSPAMHCQLHCPYCIAGTDKTTAPEKEAERGQVAALLAWMQKHQLSRLGLTGGEPSLYSRFPELIAQVQAAGMEYYMASNGLIAAAALAAILANPPLCLTLHLTPEVLYSDTLKHFISTAQQLRGAGIYAILRCNFASPDDDALAFLEVAQTCLISEMRIAIPMPNSQRGNSFVDVDKLAAFAPLLRRLVLKAENQAMQIQLSKPYPMCFMPEEVAWHFLKNGSLACVCPNHLLGFSNNLIVYPNLHFSACLGLNSRSAKPITAYDGPQDAARVFSRSISRRMHQPIMAQCCVCPLGQCGQCIGACLSYRSGTALSTLAHTGAV